MQLEYNQVLQYYVRKIRKKIGKNVGYIFLTINVNHDNYFMPFVNNEHCKYYTVLFYL